MRSMLSSLLLAIVFVGSHLSGFASERYNSLDLTQLPCESGHAVPFFYALEFTDKGGVRFPAQRELILSRLMHVPPRAAGPVTDLIFFVHGWNKNPLSAERDYQDFLCRLHSRLRMTLGVADRKREDGFMVVGVFWPSTISRRESEPAVLLPLSYLQIQPRVRIVAAGLANFLVSLTPTIDPLGPPETRLRLHLIGHSFGGRMLVNTLEELQRIEALARLLTRPAETNVVLLNAAIAPDSFEWLEQAVNRAIGQGSRARFTSETRSFLFNVHSFQDVATGTAFPLASWFTNDAVTCAAGACGVPRYMTVCVDSAARVMPATSITAMEPTSMNAWNVDATEIIFDHTDIYKGRVVSLLANLLYDSELKASLPRGAATTSEQRARCAIGQEGTRAVK